MISQCDGVDYNFHVSEHPERAIQGHFADRASACASSTTRLSARHWAACSAAFGYRQYGDARTHNAGAALIGITSKVGGGEVVICATPSGLLSFGRKDCEVVKPRAKIKGVWEECTPRLKFGRIYVGERIREPGAADVGEDGEPEGGVFVEPEKYRQLPYELMCLACS
jgi:hypothetical protein